MNVNIFSIGIFMTLGSLIGLTLSLSFTRRRISKQWGLPKVILLFVIALAMSLTAALLAALNGNMMMIPRQ